jgi:sortase A
MTTRQGALRVVERALMAVGLGLLGWTAAVIGEAAVLQRLGERQLEEMISRAAPIGSRARTEREGPSTFRARPPVRGELLGRVELPRLGLRAVFLEGIEETTLRRAVGHIPDTGLPGTAGTVGLAAHRDSYFRALKDVRVGDELFVTTPLGRFRYVVSGTWIVRPEDTWVLSPTRHESVTLVTCYPFRYIGLAPQRFIVRADRRDEDMADATAAAAKGTIAGEGSMALAPTPHAVKPAGRKSLKPASREVSRKAKPGQKTVGRKRGFWKRLLLVFA